MSVLEVDSSNACIPSTSPLYSIIPPLPTTTRGEACSSLDSFHVLNENKHVLLYGNGRLIVCRNLFVDDIGGGSNGGDGNKLIQAFIYRGHMAQVTCARFSPSGAYVASSDIRGNLRVWSFDNEEHLCKLNLPRALGGPIRDISWDKSNRRICIVGDTSPSDIPCRFIHWNTGVTCGELGIHQRNRVSSCSVRRNLTEKEGYNAFSIVTGGREDHSVFLNVNAPRSYECNALHTRGAIHSVRFSHAGDMVASVGADHNICIFVYEGTQRQLVLKCKIEEGHRASIYACDFSMDDTLLLTCSVDGTIKVWDTATGHLVRSIDILAHHLQHASATTSKSTTIITDEDRKNFKGGMQIGCKSLTTSTAVSISSNGRIAIIGIIDTVAPPQSSSFLKILMGHQSPIAAMSLQSSNNRFTLYTGDTDGIVCQWDISSGVCTQQINDLERVHAGTITSIQYVQDSRNLLSVGWDDTLRVSSSTHGNVMHAVESVQLQYQPSMIVGGNAISVIVTVGGIVLVKDGKIASDNIITLPYEALSACIAHDDTYLCLGGKDNNIYIYAIQKSTSYYTIQEKHVITSGHLRPIYSLLFSHDSSRLASADSRDICVWNFDITLQDYTPIISKNRWCFHSQKITSLAWNPLYKHILASAGLDDSIYIWNMDKKMKRIHYPFSHRGGINGLVFLNEFLLLSVGNDGCICTWDIKGDLEKKFGMRF